MPQISDKKELQKLVSLLLDEMISDDQQIRLQQLLSASKHNRQLYLELTQLESLLHWEKGSADFNYISDEESSNIISFSVFAWFGTLAAAFVALFGAMWLFTEGPLNNWNSGTNLSSNQFAVNQSPPGTRQALDNLTHNLLESKDTNEFNLLDPYKISATTALNGLSMLANNHRESELGMLEHHGSLSRWNRIPNISTAAENGVLPYDGSDMIALQELYIDVDAQVARSIDTVQIVDVRTALHESKNDHAALSASAKFNQSFGESQEGAEFGISLQGFRSDGEEFIATTDLVYANSYGDLDVRTWNTLDSQIALSQDTEFVVVSLITSKQGPDALLANTCRYYSDDFQVRLLFNGQTALGPI